MSGRSAARCSATCSSTGWCSSRSSPPRRCCRGCISGVLGLPSQPELVSRATLDWWYLHDWIPIVVLIAIATTYAAVQLPSLGHRVRGLAGASSSGFWRRCFWCCSCSRCTASGRWRFGDDISLGIELLVSAAAMVVPWIVGRGLQQSLVAAVDLDRRGQRPASSAAWSRPVGTSLSDRARAARSAGVRGHRPADVAGAALPADHRLHRSREPRHDRR